MKCDICDNCIKKDVYIYRDNSEICGEDYHEFVADFNVLDKIRDEIERATIEMDYDTAKEALAVIDKYRSVGV